MATPTLPSFPGRPLTEAVVRVLESYYTDEPRDPFTYHLAATQLDRLLLVDQFPLSIFYEVGVPRLQRSVIVFARSYGYLDSIGKELMLRVDLSQHSVVTKSRLRHLILDFLSSC